MSCKHGNHEDACDLCDAEDAIWKRLAAEQEQYRQCADALNRSIARADSLQADNDRLRAELADMTATACEWQLQVVALKAELSALRSGDMVEVPREIDRSKHGGVLMVWNDCMITYETLERTWPRLVHAMLSARPK